MLLPGSKSIFHSLRNHSWTFYTQNTHKGSIVIFYTPVERRDVWWNRPVRLSVCPSVRPSTIACERDILKTACRIDFTFWYGLNTTKTSDAIDLGHSTKTKMAATAVLRLTLYPMQDTCIACEHDILKTACQIDFTFWYGLNTTKTSDAIDLGVFHENQDGRHSSLKINIVPYAGYCLWTRYLENRLSDWLHILIWP